MYIKRAVNTVVLLFCFFVILSSCKKNIIPEEEKDVKLESLEKRYMYLVNIDDFNNANEITPDEYSYLFWLLSNEDDSVNYDNYETQLCNDFNITKDYLKQTSFIDDEKKTYIKPNDILNFKYKSHEILEQVNIDGNVKTICNYVILETLDGEENEYSYIYEYILKDSKIISGKTISIE